jgi:predicted DCC family thiol-disulfide oxidoreductase YuxK
MLVEGRVGRTERPPYTPVLIYDGRCGFCRRWVDRVRRWDRRRRVRYLSLREDDAVVVSGRERVELERAVHLVRPDGAVFAGAAAVRELCSYLPGGWMPRSVLRLPGVSELAPRVYRWVARTYGPVR